MYLTLKQQESEQAAEGGYVDVQVGDKTSERHNRINPLAEASIELIAVEGYPVAKHQLVLLYF